MYILTLYSLSSSWGQLFEHLCLFWTLTAAERSAPTSGLSCSPLLTPRGSPLPASPDPPSQDNPSPFLMLPKPRSADFTKGNSKPSSYYSAGKQKKCTTSKPQSNRSVCLPTSTGQAPAPRPLIGRRAVEVKTPFFSSMQVSWILYQISDCSLSMATSS